jgi:hypothetical protein
MTSPSEDKLWLTPNITRRTEIRDGILERERLRRRDEKSIAEERANDIDLWRDLSLGFPDPAMTKLIDWKNQPQAPSISAMQLGAGKNRVFTGYPQAPMSKMPPEPSKLECCPVVETIDWRTRANLFEQLLRAAMRFLPKHLRLEVMTALDRRP